VCGRGDTCVDWFDLSPVGVECVADSNEIGRIGWHWYKAERGFDALGLPKTGGLSTISRLGLLDLSDSENRSNEAE
jgi:hypothetical protein